MMTNGFFVISLLTNSSHTIFSNFNINVGHWLFMSGGNDQQQDFNARVYSELCQTSKMEPFAKYLTAKNR